MEQEGGGAGGLRGRRVVTSRDSPASGPPEVFTKGLSSSMTRPLRTLEREHQGGRASVRQPI